MLTYFRTLPNQPLSSKRRFVVVATAFSFALVLLAWMGILVLGRGTEQPASAPSVPQASLPEAPPAEPRPLEIPLAPQAEKLLPSPAAATPLIDVGQISTNLLKAFGPP